MTELKRISFYQTLANRETQRVVLETVKQKVTNGGMTREEYEAIKDFPVSSGLNVEGFIDLNERHGIIAWTENGERIVRVPKEQL